MMRQPGKSECMACLNDQSYLTAEINTTGKCIHSLIRGGTSIPHAYQRLIRSAGVTPNIQPALVVTRTASSCTRLDQAQKRLEKAPAAETSSEGGGGIRGLCTCERYVVIRSQAVERIIGRGLKVS